LTLGLLFINSNIKFIQNLTKCKPNYVRISNMHESLEYDIQIAKKLVRTWPAFFSRFGRLTEIQRLVIPHIIQGKDVLVCSATASGKTEAVCAPLLEINSEQRDPWRILYIAPTRALVNDLFLRLHGPLTQLGYRISRYTGDHHDKTHDAKIIIATPESFDSMLCRGKNADGNGHLLANVVGVVIDEIHLLYGTSRGEQLKWLIDRLRRLRKYALIKRWIKSDSIQIVGLSATLPDAGRVMSHFLNSEGQLISTQVRRDIETVAVECENPNIEDALPAYLSKLQKTEKVLVFCNSRKRVDNLSANLRKSIESYGFKVCAHHGSLSKRVREDAEDILRNFDQVVLFSTSTLEIGVDIGDVDIVILDGPAPDISSLLQRIGRGNRRTQKTRVMTCAGDVAEVIIQSAMIEAARNGDLGLSNNGMCFGVIVQQIASYIFQGPSRSRGRSNLVNFLNQCAPGLDANLLLDTLIQQEEFYEDGAGIRLNDSWRDRSGRGDIHSNIEGSIGTSIVDMDSGESIASGIRYGGGKVLSVGGRFLNVRKWRDNKLEVKRISDGTSLDAAWGYITKAWMKGDAQPYAVKKYLGFLPNQWPVIGKSGHIYVFHFGGGKRKAIIGLIRDENKFEASEIRVNEWYIKFPESIFKGKPDWITAIGFGQLSLAIQSNLDKLERALARPYINKKLPINLRYKEVSSWLNLENELNIYTESQWLECTADAESSVLSLLAGNIPA